MFIRILSSVAFLFLIVLFVPLAFDVGGRDAGLAYSLALVTFYLFLSILRVSTPDSSRFRWTIVQILRSAQWIIVPALLIWALGRFSVDTDNSSGSWVERTFKVTKDAATETHTTTWSRMFGSGGLFDSALLKIWDKSLQISSPFFQLCEGFCSLLVIQATGQLTRWLVNRSDRSDAWMLAIIVAAAGISSSSVYFLWRVLQFPDISTLDATLIGITIAAALRLYRPVPLSDLHGLQAECPVSGSRSHEGRARLSTISAHYHEQLQLVIAGADYDARFRGY
jgi:hypothetical protein